MSTQPTTPLHELARSYGVATCYRDDRKHVQFASTESLLAGLSALGVDAASVDDVPAALTRRRYDLLSRGIEPVGVVWGGQTVEFDLTLPAEQTRGIATCHVELEQEQRPIMHPVDLETIRPLEIRVDGGRFSTFRIQLPGGLCWGYHRLRVETSGREFESLLISSPQRAYSPPADNREWGCFLPLYALGSERNWGAGDFTDLHDVARWTADLGGRVVGTLPLLAAYLDDPCEESPYAPASRLAWNEFYVDVTRIPEFAEHQAAKELVESRDFVDEVASLRNRETVDYHRLMALKRQVLQLLADFFFLHGPRRRVDQFERFLKEHPYAEDYARFRAVHERQRRPWHDWPSRMRHGELTDADHDARSKRYHLYVQWIAAEQIESLADAADGGLYLDLPLGVRTDGYDVWRWRSVYAETASAGSPPDAMWTKGQDWSFPPLHPEEIRRQGYRHFRDYLTHHMRMSRWLRIDHVMQLHRLYWIPHGLGPHEGVYVEYRPDEFYAILTLESHRWRTAVIGENLGMVPPEVNVEMDRHSIHKMYIVQYEVASDSEDGASSLPADVVAGSWSADGAAACRETPYDGLAAAPRAVEKNSTYEPLRPSYCFVRKERHAESSRSSWAAPHVPSGSLASLNTHDMPTLAAWWRGLDITLRQEIGLLDERGVEREQARLKQTKIKLTGWLRTEGWLRDEDPDEGEPRVLTALFEFLSASPAGVVMVNLEDLWLETRPQNVPGTGPERPNWRRKAALRFEEFSRHPDILAVLGTVAEIRRGKLKEDCQSPVTNEIRTSHEAHAESANLEKHEIEDRRAGSSAASPAWRRRLNE